MEAEAKTLLLKGVPLFAGFGERFEEAQHPDIAEGERRPACAKLLRRRSGERFSETYLSVVIASSDDYAA